MLKTGAGNHTQLYSDLTELQKLKSKAKSESGQGLQLAAQQFEQLFLNMLLRSMRDANSALSEDNFMNSSQTQFYQGMYDNQIAMELANAKGIGLSDILVRQLGGQVKQGAPNPELGNIEGRRLNQALDQAGAIAAMALLAKAAGQENPPGISLTHEQSNAVTNIIEQQLNTAVKTVDRDLPERFSDPEEFVEKLMPLANKVATELGVDPRILLAQSALETGWGQFMIRDSSGVNTKNLFNIKAGSSWKGGSARVFTLEYRNGVAQREQAQFRSYMSYEDSFRDYVDFLKNSPRYKLALENSSDPYAYIQKLQEAGYATDPEYADKIKKIFEGELLASKKSDATEG